MSNPGRFKSVWKGLWLNRTEEKLSDAEERYHAIFDQAADSILVTDIDTGEIIDFNCQAYETLGYTREEFVKLKIGDFDPSFKRERTRMQEFREKGLKHTFLTKNRTKSGESRDVLVTIQAIHIGGKVMMMNIWHDITETKKAEEALRDNEERMKAIVRNAPIGIATSGADRYFLSANEEFSRIIGYTEAELQKMSFKDITHPEDIEESALKMGDLDAGKVASFSQEKRYIKKDGNVIIGKVIVSAVRGHEQRPRIYVVHLEDITEQKTAEQALRESEEKFSQAFNSASDAMAIRSAPGGKFIAVNDNYVKLTGYSREELINRTTDELNMWGRPADRPILLGALAEKGRMFQLEFLLRKKSGEIRTCLSSTEPITIGGKKCWIGVIQDITEKKAVEQALRESEEKFSHAFNAASDAMAVFSADKGKFIVANENYIKLSGYSREELIGRNADELEMWGSPEDRVNFLGMLAREGRVSDNLFQFRPKTGKIRTCLISAEPITVGGQKCLISVIQDITEQKAADQALRESEEKFSKTFATSASAIVVTRLSDRIIVDVNESYTHFTGYTREEVIGHTGEEFKLWVDDKEREYFSNLLRKEGKFKNFELHSHGKSGEIRIGLASAEIINIGGVPHRIVTIQDITERKKTEQALKDSEEKFSKAFNSSAAIICITRMSDQKIIEVNESYTHFTGYTRQEVLGHTGKELGLWIDENELVNFKNLVEKGGGLKDFELHSRAKSGEIYIGLASAEIINLGGVNHLIVIIYDITERKKAEEALKESEEKFSKAFKATPMAVCITSNKDNRFIEVNESFSRITGYSLDEIIGHTADNLHLWVGEEEKTKTFSELTTKGKVNYAEFKSRMKSGEIRTLLASAENLTIRGEPCRMVVLADITERKQHELEKEQNSKFLQALIDSIPLPVFYKDTNGVYLGCNERYSQFIGVRKEDFIGQDAYQISPENLANNYVQKDRELFENPGTQVYESKVEDYTGKIHDVVFHKATFPNLDGSVGGLIGAILDITERKKAEEALRDSEEKFSKAFNASPDCMAISRLGDGRYIEVNDSFIRFTGYSREYILGKSFNNIKKWDEAGSRNAIMEKLRKDGRVVKEDFSFRVKSGEVKSMLYSAETLKIGGVDCVLSVTTDITERKKAEEALRDSEEKFSKAFKATPIGVCITSNQDNRFIEVNDSFYRFTGYSHDEIIGHSASELNLWVDEDERLKFFGDYFEKGRVYNAEFRSRMKSGEIRTFLASAENITIRGEACRMMVLADITERKMAELALADSEKKLRIMFNSVTNGIAVVDLNGTITGVNRRVLEMHGFADDSEVIGKNAMDLVVPREREQAAVNITNNLKERKSTGLEYTLLRKDGTTFLGEISVSLLNDASGAPIGYIAVIRDITQRKEIELALKESEVKYSTLVENSNDGIAVVQDLKVKFFNDIAYKKTGYNPQEVFDKPFLDFVPPQYRPMIAERYRQRISGQQQPQSYELEMLNKNNQSIPIEISINLIEYNGRPAEMVVVRDISERKQAEAQLQEAYRKETEMRQELEVEMKRRAEFTRALVHELKTPLTPILASSDGLLEILEEEPAKSLAANVNRGAYNMNKRIDELLDVARSELNVLKVTLTPVNLRPILKEVAAEMSVVAKKKAQALNLEIPRILPKVNADYSRIKQVVDNLVTNAVKFTPKGGKITISARENEGKLIVEVRDTGVGLTEDELEKVFEPYYHKEQKNNNFSGLGLGLSLCKKFVELHGGEIWAASTPGKGSSFSFSLPVIHRK